MSKKAGAWMLAMLSVLLISLGFTPYSQTANYLLISLRLALVAVLSILFVRERWKYRHHPHGPDVAPDTGDTILRRFRRWFYDEKT
jgi:hypothetical protein